MKQTAWAPSNIAFIKYWGKKDEELRLPLNDSFSMNLSDTYTVTTVEFSSSLTHDEVTLLDGTFSSQEVARVSKSLDRIRKKAGSTLFARVITRNTFPKGAGAAASASGFAALTVAAFAALDLSIGEKELTVFARMGSGSACRSIPDGFVVWEKGTTSETSYAYSLYPHDYWDLRDILVVVDSGMKKVSTTEGMTGITTSPNLPARLAAIPTRMDRVKHAFVSRDFSALGAVIEEDCLDMHEVMQTQMPPLLYWNETTRRIMDAVRQWRRDGLGVYFTIDAGPNVHLICEAASQELVMEQVKQLSGVQSVIINKPAKGAHCIDQHLS